VPGPCPIQRPTTVQDGLCSRRQSDCYQPRRQVNRQAQIVGRQFLNRVARTAIRTAKPTDMTDIGRSGPTADLRYERLTGTVPTTLKPLVIVIGGSSGESRRPQPVSRRRHLMVLTVGTTHNCRSQSNRTFVGRLVP
jgi:hypothetical protein